MLSRGAPRLYNVSVSMGFTVSMAVARFNASSLNGYAVSMPAAFLVSWAAPVSVETQNFASVHKESRHDAIVRFDGLRPFDDLKK